MTFEIGIFILLFIVALVASIGLTNWYTKTREIGNSQILIALCVTAIGLFVAKKIKVFEYGDFKIEAALTEAQNTPIFKEITLIPVDGLVIGVKENIYALNEMVLEKRTDALAFYMGYQNYGSKEIDTYLQILGKVSLQYVLFEEFNSREFIGIINYSDLEKQLNDYNRYPNVITTDVFRNWIKNSESAKLKQKLNGFISNDLSVKKNTKKIEALERMEKYNLDYLPVVDSTESFIGIVKRDRLAASLLIEVSRSLQTSPTSQTTR